MSRQRQLLLFFIVVYLFTWGVAAIIALVPAAGGSGIRSPLFFLAVYGPSLISLALTAIYGGRSGLAALFRRLNPLAFNPIWYLVAFLVLPVATAMWMLVAGAPFSFPAASAVPGILGLGLLLDPGPLGEELGWRGYALPRLLDRWSPATSALVLGVVWGVWHLPVFVIPGFPQSQFNFWWFVVGTITLTILMTWCHLHTKGNILPAIIIHLMANHTRELIGSPAGVQAATAGQIVICLLVLGLDRKRFFARPAAVVAG